MQQAHRSSKAEVLGKYSQRREAREDSKGGSGLGGPDPASPLAGDYRQVAEGDLVGTATAVRLRKVRIRAIPLVSTMFFP